MPKPKYKVGNVLRTKRSGRPEYVLCTVISIEKLRGANQYNAVGLSSRGDELDEYGWYDDFSNGEENDFVLDDVSKEEKAFFLMKLESVRNREKC